MKIRDPRLEAAIAAQAGAPPVRRQAPAGQRPQVITVNVTVLAFKVARMVESLPKLPEELSRVAAVVAGKQARGEPVNDVDRADVAIFAALLEAQERIGRAFALARAQVEAETRAAAAAKAAEQDELPRAPGDDADAIIGSRAGAASAVDSVGDPGVLPGQAAPAHSQGGC